MRQKIVAGNWKMNTTIAEGITLTEEIIKKSTDLNGVKLIIAPPFTHLYPIGAKIGGSKLSLASQDCAAQDKGAYTGDVSALMVKSANAEYVILGHSERREYHNECSKTLNKKIILAYQNNLIPIYCVGERLEEREAGVHFDIIKSQIEEVVFNLTQEQFKSLIVAYEPVWAIGTGKTATSDQAQEVHAFIRQILTTKFGALAQDTSILYGGSCKPSNAQELFSKQDVDGGLIGGASLAADDFIAIAKSF